MEVEQKKSLPSPMTVEQQIENLKSINLKIENEEFAKETLNRISYFRLIKAYGLGLKPKNGNYFDGITFERIVKIYEFNSRLRNIIFPLIEDVEISLRCRLANHMSHMYGALGYEISDNFSNSEIHNKILEDLDTEIERAKSPFVDNFRERYDEGKLPFYAAVELFTFGMLSKMFANLKNSDKKAIASEFKVGYTYLESWFKSITNVRNICAHYGRLYNIKLAIKPELYKEYPKEYNYRIFGVLLTLKYIVSNKSLWQCFMTDLCALFNQYQEYVAFEAIGFPEDWEDYLKID